MVCCKKTVEYTLTLDQDEVHFLIREIEKCPSRSEGGVLDTIRSLLLDEMRL